LQPYFFERPLLWSVWRLLDTQDTPKKVSLGESLLEDSGVVGELLLRHQAFLEDPGLEESA
jgi:hypothetical protein